MEAVPEEPVNEPPVFSRQRPGPSRAPPSFDSFEPQRDSEAPSGGRKRLEVTQIRVRPQVAKDFIEEPLDIDAFRQVASRFRQRGSQQ